MNDHDDLSQKSDEELKSMLVGEIRDIANALSILVIVGGGLVLALILLAVL